jgi:hypothetical protein
MEAVRASETSVHFDLTWRYNPEGCDCHTRRHEHLKPDCETSGSHGGDYEDDGHLGHTLCSFVEGKQRLRVPSVYPDNGAKIK